MSHLQISMLASCGAAFAMVVVCFAVPNHDNDRLLFIAAFVNIGTLWLSVASLAVKGEKKPPKT